MTAEIIQFVLGFRPERRLTPDELVALKSRLQVQSNRLLSEIYPTDDYAPSEYVAPSDNCA